MWPRPGRKPGSKTELWVKVTLVVQVDRNDPENYERMMELWFLFCLIWSVGAGVDEAGRKKMDSFIREMEGQFPAKV